MNMGREKRHRRLPAENFFGFLRLRLRLIFGFSALFAALLLLHYPLLRLPYYWDEAGYYIPAALDFLRSARLVPSDTLHTGHTPLVVIYLALAWRVFGFSPRVTRVAMTLVAAVTLAAVYALGRRLGSRETACWSVLLLALSPLFFAQSVLVHLDLAAGLFTLLALWALLGGTPWKFALAAVCAMLSKETAVVLLPVGWLFCWWRYRRAAASAVRAWWIAFVAPLAVLAAWAVFYHHATGYWTGNSEYLRYNLYATLTPVRVLLTLLRRLYQTFIGGFNWLLAAGALAGIGWARGNGMGSSQTKAHSRAHESQPNGCHPERREGSLQLSFFLLGGGLTAAYLLMLSLVGGAILPRYLLPVYPPLLLMAVLLIWRLPRPAARSLLALAGGCFVWAWFLNPPYPFPLEDNLAYADFVRLHQQAAQFLEARQANPRILTAWPATDELARPFLGYVRRPLHVVGVEGFGRQDFRGVAAPSFDCLYLYSRRWEPARNWLRSFPLLEDLQERYFDYQPQMPAEELADRYHLRLLASFARRGQWVRIYAPSMKPDTTQEGK
jgi:4-amino-4-deoxy-L-arabinose transferase-like glycosyltransferase